MIRAIVVTALAATLYACGGAPAPAPAEPGAGPQGDPGMGPGRAAFIIRNESSVPICYVNISMSADSNWGPDRLGATETIQPGIERAWTMNAGQYDYRLLDCDRRTMMQRMNTAVPAGDGLIVTFRSPEY